MPEMKAVFLGCSPMSAAACFNDAMTPKSPQPGHHHDGVVVAKSFAVSVVAMSTQTPTGRGAASPAKTDEIASMISIGRNGLPLYFSTVCMFGNGPTT